MPRDPLELFNDLPDYPGKTPPKNRPTTNKSSLGDEQLGGAKGKEFIISGSKVQLYTVGQVAKALGRKPGTIRMWELKGWIPKATYRSPAPKAETLKGKTPKGRRLYSQAQVECMFTGADRFKIDDPIRANWDGFRNYIKDNWLNET